VKGYTLADLAAVIGAELVGDGSKVVVSVAPIDAANVDQLTFLANPRYRRALSTTGAGAVILARGEDAHGRNALYVDQPYVAFARALELFDERPGPPAGIHPTALIARTSRVGDGASIGAYAVVGEGVVIGSDAVIHPHVVIYPAARIGDRFTAHAGAVVRECVEIGDDVVLQAGAVIGGDGFGYVPLPGGIPMPLRQIGTVSLGDHVDIGSNTTVDRATVGTTRIARGVKLDNLVMIAHGCSIGEATMLAAQFGMAGSSHLGARVMAGGQSGVGGHAEVGEGVQIAAQAGVPGSVDRGRIVAGTPATDISSWRRYSVLLRRLPELFRRVTALERREDSKDAV
jgi:UDP-3-O-[3-hydroxymyristoyl] glucosamine N-acyltransferase